MKYYCDNCDVQKGNLSYLKVHKQAKHESRLYSCEKCNYETKWHADFRKHVKNKHENFDFSRRKKENAENNVARNAIKEKND